MTPEMFVNIIRLFGVFLLILIAAGQLHLNKKEEKNYLVAALSVLIALYDLSNSFHLFSQLDNWHKLFPFIYITGRFSLYCVVPMTYLFFIELPQNKFVLKRNMFIHVVIPLCALFVLILFARFPENPGGDRQNYIRFLYNNVPAIRMVSNFSIVPALIYFSLTTRFYLVLYKKSKGESKNNIFIITIFCFLLLLMTLTFFWRYDSSGILHYIFKLRFTIMAVYLLIFSYRYPFVMNIIKLEAYRDYYVKSHLENLQTDKILASLERLMDKERLFSDRNLSLKKTAEKLAISPHQLSEILNTRLHKTFIKYIKEKRIKFARELLVSWPEKTIIEISAKSGFNSISNFNDTFKNITGMSPTEYRKKHIGKK